MKYLLTVTLLLFAGCITPTEAQRGNGGAITDTAEIFDKEGATAGSPITGQNLRNAKTNEATLGSPKKRLDPRDLAAQETNRVQAQKDAEAGGFWWMAGASLLGVGSLAASLFGLSGVANWLTGLQGQLKDARKQVTHYESQAQNYEGYLGILTGALQNFRKKDDTISATLLDDIALRARDTGNKPAFDKAVDATLNT